MSVVLVASTAISNREAVCDRAGGCWSAPAQVQEWTLLPDFTDSQDRRLLDVFQPGRILRAFSMFRVGDTGVCVPLVNVHGISCVS